MLKFGALIELPDGTQIELSERDKTFAVFKVCLINSNFLNLIYLIRIAAIQARHCLSGVRPGMSMLLDMLILKGNLLS